MFSYYKKKKEKKKTNALINIPIIQFTLRYLEKKSNFFIVRTKYLSLCQMLNMITRTGGFRI